MEFLVCPSLPTETQLIWFSWHQFLAYVRAGAVLCSTRNRLTLFEGILAFSCNGKGSSGDEEVVGVLSTGSKYGFSSSSAVLLMVTAMDSAMVMAMMRIRVITFMAMKVMRERGGCGLCGERGSQGLS